MLADATHTPWGTFPVFEDAIDVAEDLRDAREVFEDAIDVAEDLRGAREVFEGAIDGTLPHGGAIVCAEYY